MPFNVAGRAALITGAASGIGHAFAKQLLRSGLRSLVAVDFSPSLPAVVEELREEFPEATLRHAVADVTDEAALEAAFDTKLDEPLTIVANNAGIGGADWRKTLAVDLTAVVAGTSLALSRFKSQSTGGVVVNVSSMAGLAPMSFDPAYTAAKHGVVGYSRCFKHLGRKGVRVNCLAPAFTNTPLVRGLLGHPQLGKAGKAAVDELGGLIPMEVVVGGFMEVRGQAKERSGPERDERRKRPPPPLFLSSNHARRSLWRTRLTMAL